MQPKFDRQFLLSLKRLAASLLVVGAAALGGCALAGFGPDVDNSVTTSSVTTSSGSTSSGRTAASAPADILPLRETVDPSDWETVRSVLATALVSQPAGAPLPWQNAITGTVGTIIPMDVSAQAEGRFCRSFSTTLNGIGGIQQYRGDACKVNDGHIELVGLAPHNAVVHVTTLPPVSNLR